MEMTEKMLDLQMQMTAEMAKTLIPELEEATGVSFDPATWFLTTIATMAVEQGLNPAAVLADEKSARLIEMARQLRETVV